MPERDPTQVVSALLKHDTKVTTDEIVLLRAINDPVLSFPGLVTLKQEFAVRPRFPARF